MSSFTSPQQLVKKLMAFCLHWEKYLFRTSTNTRSLNVSPIFTSALSLRISEGLNRLNLHQEKSVSNALHCTLQELVEESIYTQLWAGTSPKWSCIKTRDSFDVTVGETAHTHRCPRKIISVRGKNPAQLPRAEADSLHAKRCCNTVGFPLKCE